MEFDPKGFFIIMLDRENGEMLVEHYENVEKGGKIVSGKLVHVFAGDEAQTLCQTIISSGAVSRLDHAAYLGRELEKAEMALKRGWKYVQDVDCDPEKSDR